MSGISQTQDALESDVQNWVLEFEFETTDDGDRKASRMVGDIMEIEFGCRVLWAPVLCAA